MAGINNQRWLNDIIPPQQQNNTRELYIWPDNLRNDTEHQELYQNVPEGNKIYIPARTLIGILDFTTFPNLEKLSVQKQSITELNLKNCNKLTEIRVNDNLLKKIVWPNNTPRLKVIEIENNNFETCDLSVFSDFPNLQVLTIGTKNRDRIRDGIYNRFYGSLKYLENLVLLQSLSIDATDVDSGLEYLPTDELNFLTFGSCDREEARVKNLWKTLADQSVQLGIILKPGGNFDEWAANEGVYSEVDGFDECMDKIEAIREWQDLQQTLQNQTQVRRIL